MADFIKLEDEYYEDLYESDSVFDKRLLDFMINNQNFDSSFPMHYYD